MGWQVTALVAEIQRLPSSDKCLIFSEWDEVRKTSLPPSPARPAGRPLTPCCLCVCRCWTSCRSLSTATMSGTVPTQPTSACLPVSQPAGPHLLLLSLPSARVCLQLCPAQGRAQGGLDPRGLQAGGGPALPAAQPEERRQRSHAGGGQPRLPARAHLQRRHRGPGHQPHPPQRADQAHLRAQVGRPASQSERGTAGARA